MAFKRRQFVISLTEEEKKTGSAQLFCLFSVDIRSWFICFRLAGLEGKCEYELTCWTLDIEIKACELSRIREQPVPNESFSSIFFSQHD